MEKLSYVYMMGSTSRHALYTGVTAVFYLRVWQHKNNQGGCFTTKYKCHRLVYFEQFTNVEAAIAREKEIKGWRREKKDKLVEFYPNTFLAFSITRFVIRVHPR